MVCVSPRAGYALHPEIVSSIVILAKLRRVAAEPFGPSVHDTLLNGTPAPTLVAPAWASLTRGGGENETQIWKDSKFRKRVAEGEGHDDDDDER